MENIAVLKYLESIMNTGGAWEAALQQVTLLMWWDFGVGLFLWFATLILVALDRRMLDRADEEARANNLRVGTPGLYEPKEFVNEDKRLVFLWAAAVCFVTGVILICIGFAWRANPTFYAIRLLLGD